MGWTSKNHLFSERERKDRDVEKESSAILQALLRCMCVSYRRVEFELPYTDNNAPPISHSCKIKSPMLGLGYFPPRCWSWSFGHAEMQFFLCFSQLVA